MGPVQSITWRQRARALKSWNVRCRRPDPDLQELVSVSFLENLDQSDAEYEGIKALLGPNLRRQLAEYES